MRVSARASGTVGAGTMQGDLVGGTVLGAGSRGSAGDHSEDERLRGRNASGTEDMSSSDEEGAVALGRSMRSMRFSSVTDEMMQSSRGRETVQTGAPPKEEFFPQASGGARSGAASSARESTGAAGQRSRKASEVSNRKVSENTSASSTSSWRGQQQRERSRTGSSSGFGKPSRRGRANSARLRKTVHSSDSDDTPPAAAEEVEVAAGAGLVGTVVVDDDEDTRTILQPPGDDDLGDDDKTGRDGTRLTHQQEPQHPESPSNLKATFLDLGTFIGEIPGGPEHTTTEAGHTPREPGDERNVRRTRGPDNIGSFSKKAVSSSSQNTSEDGARGRRGRANSKPLLTKSASQRSIVPVPHVERHRSVTPPRLAGEIVHDCLQEARKNSSRGDSFREDSSSSSSVGPTSSNSASPTEQDPPSTAEMKNPKSSSRTPVAHAPSTKVSSGRRTPIAGGGRDPTFFPPSRSKRSEASTQSLLGAGPLRHEASTQSLLGAGRSEASTQSLLGAGRLRHDSYEDSSTASDSVESATKIYPAKTTPRRGGKYPETEGNQLGSINERAFYKSRTPQRTTSTDHGHGPLRSPADDLPQPADHYDLLAGAGIAEVVPGRGGAAGSSSPPADEEESGGAKTGDDHDAARQGAAGGGARSTTPRSTTPRSTTPRSTTPRSTTPRSTTPTGPSGGVPPQQGSSSSSSSSSSSRAGFSISSQSVSHSPTDSPIVLVNPPPGTTTVLVNAPVYEPQRSATPSARPPPAPGDVLRRPTGSSTPTGGQKRASGGQNPFISGLPPRRGGAATPTGGGRTPTNGGGKTLNRPNSGTNLAGGGRPPCRQASDGTSAPPQPTPTAAVASEQQGGSAGSLLPPDQCNMERKVTPRTQQRTAMPLPGGPSSSSAGVQPSASRLLQPSHRSGTTANRNDRHNKPNPYVTSSRLGPPPGRRAGGGPRPSLGRIASSFQKQALTELDLSDDERGADSTDEDDLVDVRRGGRAGRYQHSSGLRQPTASRTGGNSSASYQGRSSPPTHNNFWSKNLASSPSGHSVRPNTGSFASSGGSFVSAVAGSFHGAGSFQYGPSAGTYRGSSPSSSSSMAPCYGGGPPASPAGSFSETTFRHPPLKDQLTAQGELIRSRANSGASGGGKNRMPVNSPQTLAGTDKNRGAQSMAASRTAAASSPVASPPAPRSHNSSPPHNSMNMGGLPPPMLSSTSQQGSARTNSRTQARAVPGSSSGGFSGASGGGRPGDPRAGDRGGLPPRGPPGPGTTRLRTAILEPVQEQASPRY